MWIGVLGCYRRSMFQSVLQVRIQITDPVMAELLGLPMKVAVSPMTQWIAFFEMSTPMWNRGTGPSSFESFHIVLNRVGLGSCWPALIGTPR